ncbi:MAG: glycoside hydrolase family 125 protein, partial [Bacteroidales bacterium]|nr:glycoside hydrolase family 125 protein [Bacteroidales bacterium]
MKLFLKITAAAAALLLCGSVSAQGEKYPDRRPPVGERLFTSQAVEKKIDEVCSLLTNPKLRWMMRNCFPNTLDTTVHFSTDENGNPRTFVYTGDIHAMWLRDSGAQVWPYLQLASRDEHLRELLEGVVRCQLSLVNIDPYANAFNDGPTGGYWMSDKTDMN